MHIVAQDFVARTRHPSPLRAPRSKGVRPLDWSERRSDHGRGI